MKRLSPVSIFACVIGVLTVTSCQPQVTPEPTNLPFATTTPGPTNLPFEVIENAELVHLGQTMYESGNPDMRVVGALQDLPKLDSLHTKEATQKLETLDYKNYLAVAVFQGRKTQSGYGVQINRVSRQGNNVIILVTFRTPVPGSTQVQRVTSPYELVQVQKTGAWGEEILFTLVVNQLVVTSFMQSIP